MAVTVYLSGHLKTHTGGETEVRLDSDSGTVDGVLESLWKIHPALRDRILNEQGEIRTHVNIFAGTEDVKRLKGLQTKIAAGTEMHIFNAVSGG
jgi:sulfur-carrier protein